MKRSRLFLSFGTLAITMAVVLVAGLGRAVASEEITSPDGKLVIDFDLPSDGGPTYKISYEGKPIVLESKMGFQPEFTNGFEMVKNAIDSHASQWTDNFGERKTVPDNYQELDVDLKHRSGALMRITFRAYNEGAAFRYSFPDQDSKQFVFNSEQTEFRFPPETYGWEEHGTEGEYQRSKVDDIKPGCERPLTLEFANGLYASLAEADNENYPRMLLSKLPAISDALVSSLGGAAVVTAGSGTPWRMFVVGEKPGDLLERNYLMLDLNPPLALADTSWIKPGNMMRDVTLSTKGAEAIMDFAPTANVKYVLFDDGWYGTEDPEKGDATTVRKPALDLPAVIQYGKGKGVGVILYVDRRQMKKQRDDLFPLYASWGVVGVKLGFVDVGPQAETDWITQTIYKAADNHLMLDIHDQYRPTGYIRTYPNLLTVEGIRGNEHFPTAEHNCTVSFTRYIAGPADYTICYYDKRLKVTHAQQLAMDIVVFSPLQTVLWYDQPSQYHGEPEIEFFRHAPTVWDDTKVINGEIGKFATVARRSGDDWFIGTVNDSEPRDLKVPLDFLDPGRKYDAHLYFDDATVPTATKVGMKTVTVTNQSVLDVPLLASGGQAVWLTPAK